MVGRPFWQKRIEEGWREAPIVWLAGVRRVGKTTLVRDLPGEGVRYLNCDLPAVTEMVSDPELFYRTSGAQRIIFDEVHQLPDPSRVLKIGADLFPRLRIVATGSSTLAATRKFRDTLTGRKRLVRLTPVLWNELEAFGGATLLKRLYHGGLPQALLADGKSPGFYREWVDSFFSRDIQRLFAFRDPGKFTALFEYLMRQSGGRFELTRAASALGISRPTVESHLRAMEITHAVTVIRPFFGGGQREISRMPKIYGFDTGFVSFFRGWDPLRPDDYGPLWEHMVLEFLQAYRHAAPPQYWRDTSGREVDFVMRRDRAAVDAIECKWHPERLDPASLKAFRSHYPEGANYLVCPVGGPPYVKRVRGMEITVCSPEALIPGP